MPGRLLFSGQIKHMRQMISPFGLEKMYDPHETALSV
jgi:hypothetical protein